MPAVRRGGCSVTDTKLKTWRHLDFFEHQAYLTARVPRVRCPEHGVRQVELPSAREGSSSKEPCVPDRGKPRADRIPYLKERVANNLGIHPPLWDVRLLSWGELDWVRKYIADPASHVVDSKNLSGVVLYSDGSEGDHEEGVCLRGSDPTAQITKTARVVLDGYWQMSADLREVNMTLSSLKGSQLNGIKATNAILERADLRESALDDAQLAGAVLDRCDLRGASLRRSKLEDTPLHAARFDEATDFSDA